jgi:Na+/H+ antiporter
VEAFEAILALLLGATILSALARRLGVPYPTLLALGGAILAFTPGAPRIDLPPDLILVLFVAPILLDAAYDAPLRDLRANWLPVSSLVLVAVGLTTAAVAIAALKFFPDMPWAAAIALGAIVAPPDAVAALAVLRHAQPPYRIRVVLEGESLLNDASALIIYRVAIGAVAAGGFSFREAAPTAALVVVGSILAGWLLAWPLSAVAARVRNASESVILQFVMTFAAWLLADWLGLSAVVTVVVLGLTLGRRGSATLPARIRVPSFAIWETVTMVLNVLAFTLIGLQIRPILEGVSTPERVRMLTAAFLVLGVVITVRLAWTFIYDTIVRIRAKFSSSETEGSQMRMPSAAGALVVGWSGMRGIVTLAAALALPEDFPYRDFIQLTAFVVVLGTLLIQGLTLRPLLKIVRLPRDNVVEREIVMAREAALKAALCELENEDAPAALRLRAEIQDMSARASSGRDARDTAENALRRRTVVAARRSLEIMRSSNLIGDDAYRRIEEELDLLELSAQPTVASD